MDRATWDWSRLMDHGAEILSEDVPALTSALGRPLSIQILARPGGDGERQTSDDRTFVFVDGRYFERHKGSKDATVEKIMDHLRVLDRKRNVWANVYFACHLSPLEVDGVTAEDAAGLLLKFNRIRKRLRPSGKPER